MNRRLTITAKWTILFLFLTFILLMIFTPKGAIVLWANETYNDGSVLFFRAMNLFGDGLMFAIYLPFLLFHKFRRAIYFSLLIVVQTVIVHCFKSGLANGFARPARLFEEAGIQFIPPPGVELHYADSFPSGHATTAFTLGIFLMMFNKRSTYQLIILALALLGGFARVYLMQHFFIDVAAGFFCSLLTFYIVDYIYAYFKLYKVKGSLTRSLFPRWQPQWLESQRYRELQQFF